MAFFDNDDLNGECFIAGELGEVEEIQEHRTIVLPDGLPSSNQPFVGVGYNNQQACTFINENFYALKDCVNPVTDEQAAKIAYIRFLAVRSGLASDQFDPNAFNVRYNECVRLGAGAAAGAFVTANAHDGNPNPLHQNIRPILVQAVRVHLRRNFTDYLCVVAYMFRVRGHHWLADMDDKFKDLWNKCLKEEDTPGLDWQYIAHHAIHAVFPVILDEFWERAVQASNVAGAMMKRFDSAPAGVAGVRALEAGMNDLAVTVPGFKNQFHELYQEKDRLVEKLKNERWAGSINRRFYRADDLGFNESKFAAIASTIMSALDQFAPTSPLRQSAALRRMAQSAPISGGFTSRLIAAAANDPDNAKALVMAKAHP